MVSICAHRTNLYMAMDFYWFV